MLHDARTMFGNRSILTVHWETNTVELAEREHVTMLRPPLGYRPVEERERLPWLERLPFPWWTQAAVVAALLTTAIAIWLLTGGR